MLGPTEFGKLTVIVLVDVPHVALPYFVVTVKVAVALFALVMAGPYSDMLGVHVADMLPLLLSRVLVMPPQETVRVFVVPLTLLVKVTGMLLPNVPFEALIVLAVP